MRDYLSEIDTLFPVRRSAGQKEAFRAFALAEAEKAGVSARTETLEGHANVVFGDPLKAGVIFTAHYDTPRRALLPNLMLVTNRVLFWAYQLGIVLALLAASIGAAVGMRALSGLPGDGREGRLLMLLTYAFVYFGLDILLLRGPANRRNRNDNTGGTAAVLSLVSALGARDGAAFILFDDEEKGKKGSKAYARACPDIKARTLSSILTVWATAIPSSLSCPGARGTIPNAPCCGRRRRNGASRASSCLPARAR